MEQLCAALKASAHVKEVNLEDCGVNACCVMLGREVSAETYGRMEQQLRDARMLDLTGAHFTRLSDAGIAELGNIYSPLSSNALLINKRAVVSNKSSGSFDADFAALYLLIVVGFDQKVKSIPLISTSCLISLFSKSIRACNFSRPV